MSRVHPETMTERKLMCLGLIFVEEDWLLDDLYQVIGSDIVEGQTLDSEAEEFILKEIDDYFLRLDLNFPIDARDEGLSTLQDEWGLKDRESIIAALAQIREQGHRTKFNLLNSLIPEEGRVSSGTFEKFKQIFCFDFRPEDNLQLSDDDYKKLIEWFQRSKKYLGSVGILAWDTSRYIHLVRLAFIANYLTDAEAWSEIRKLLPIVQGRFQSWMEYSRSFLIGKTFWSGIEDTKLKFFCENLLGHPASPWKFLSVP